MAPGGRGLVGVKEVGLFMKRGWSQRGVEMTREETNWEREMWVMST